MFNFDDKNGQATFKTLTSNSSDLSSTLTGPGNIKLKFKRWHKKLNNILHKSFTKTRITGKPKITRTSKLIKERNKLRDKLKQSNDSNKAEIEKLINMKEMDIANSEEDIIEIVSIK